MANLLDTLKPRLSEAITYTAREDLGMRPYNFFMTAVTEFLPIARMDRDAELTFCMYAACVLEETWKKHVVRNEAEADQARFLEILVRYLLNVMEVQEVSVRAFLDEGPELVSSDFGNSVAKLAAKTFGDFTDGDFEAAAGFKYFVERMNLERK
jgi:hypothetical protein